MIWLVPLTYFKCIKTYSYREIDDFLHGQVFWVFSTKYLFMFVWKHFECIIWSICFHLIMNIDRTNCSTGYEKIVKMIKQESSQIRLGLLLKF